MSVSEFSDTVSCFIRVAWAAAAGKLQLVGSLQPVKDLSANSNSGQHTSSFSVRQPSVGSLGGFLLHVRYFPVSNIIIVCWDFIQSLSVVVTRVVKHCLLCDQVTLFPSMQAVVPAQAVKVKLAVYKVEFVLSRKTSRLEMHTSPRSRWNFLSHACSYEVHFSVSYVYLLIELCDIWENRTEK